MGLGDFAYQRVTVTTQQINEGNGSARLGSSLVLVGSTRIRVDRPGITSTESDKRESLLTWFVGSEKKNPACAKYCGWLKPTSRHRSALLGTQEILRRNPYVLQGHTLYYGSAIGADPMMAEIILDIACRFDRQYPCIELNKAHAST